MAETKTRFTDADVDAFLAAVEPPKRRADGLAVSALMAEVTGEQPRMYGPTIVGFGSYAYTYATGHSGVAPRLAFSPRKANLVLYVDTDFEGADALVARLGKVKTSKACIYVTDLAKLDAAALRELFERGYAASRARWPQDGPAAA